jgi:myxalamid-type polyketide synthase MxaE and MxaD
MKGREGALKLAELRRQGVGAIAPAKGAALFPWLCRSDEPCIAASPFDWSTFMGSHAARAYPIFAENAATVLDSARLRGEPAFSGNIEHTVRKAVGAVLKLPLSRLDDRQPLGAMGLTSLMAIELRNALETALKRPLSATLAWNHPTIEALIAYLRAGAPKASAASEAKRGPSYATLEVELAEVAELSDEEAFAALRNRSRAS